MKSLFFLRIACLLPLCLSAHNDGYIRYQSIRPTADERQQIEAYIRQQSVHFDRTEGMITRSFSGWHYHRDAQEGVFHDTRLSLYYALALLDAGSRHLEEEAFTIIRKVIDWQDTDPQSPSCGVWPYFTEEPLQTKKSSIDYNWADFIGVVLLDIYTGHRDRLPEELQAEIRQALIRAAEAIRKRNVHPGYTNIAVMGSYVTYMTAHLFDLPGLKEYAARRWRSFYEYTRFQGGFSEYNSPAYTVIVLDELLRMKTHIVEKEAQGMADTLYVAAWEMIARHFHQPSGQWAGPQSRSYSTFAEPSFYGLLHQALGGKINGEQQPERYNIRLKHSVPEHLSPYFLSPQYPRTEKDVFNRNPPQVEGTCLLAETYTLGSVNRSNFWRQRRPLLAYWGTPDAPSYLQLRFLHDHYDFCAANFYSTQAENKVLAAITFSTNGGDKHVRNDDLVGGRFNASDLRLRFEFGNVAADALPCPSSSHETLAFRIGEMPFMFRLFYARFGNEQGHWEKGQDGNTAWLDYVIYSGEEKEVNLAEMTAAALGFVLAMGEEAMPGGVSFSEQDGFLSARWENMQLSTPLKPKEKEENL
ncbi:MAG: hypothetical protein LBH61_04955 [Dysgonamonadaceae bacterium]|jgi:hypothetical protein|nr:hypothetical protein [Dysgonamonadaceae bacterium]